MIPFCTRKVLAKFSPAGYPLILTTQLLRFLPLNSFIHFPISGVFCAERVSAPNIRINVSIGFITVHFFAGKIGYCRMESYAPAFEKQKYSRAPWLLFSATDQNLLDTTFHSHHFL